MDLDALASLARPVHLRELFGADPGRATRYIVEAGNLRIDYSKHRLNDDVLASLLELAQDSNVEGRRDAMFAGAHINVAEDRAVGHAALRMPAG
ncbi:MAG: glucose-6-phosphate isomerase, partial [Ilumatobacter sp.]